MTENGQTKVLEMEYDQKMKEHQIWMTFKTLGALGFFATFFQKSNDIFVAGMLFLILLGIGNIKDQITTERLESIRIEVLNCFSNENTKKSN